MELSTATAQRTETAAPKTAYTRQGEFLAGMRATIPLIVGAIPFGIIFGAIAGTSKLSPAAVVAMSAFVFAGSAQFISLGLIAGGATLPFIVLTTLVVNLRHALYGATLGPHMKQLPQRWLVPLGFWLTDESFVIAVQRYERADESPYKHWYLFGSELWMYLNWQLCTVIGLIAGQSIPNPASWGLDFAMTVTFTGMLIPMLRNRPMLVAVLVAGVTAVLANGLPNKLGLMVAALLGVTAGLVAEQWKERKP